MKTEYIELSLVQTDKDYSLTVVTSEVFKTSMDVCALQCDCAADDCDCIDCD